MEGAGEDAAWASLTQLSAARGRGSNSPAITGLSPHQCSRPAARFVPGTGRDGAVQSRTPVLLSFLWAPLVEARGRWRERGRMGRGR